MGRTILIALVVAIVVGGAAAYGGYKMGDTAGFQRANLVRQQFAQTRQGGQGGIGPQPHHLCKLEHALELKVPYQGLVHGGILVRHGNVTGSFLQVLDLPEAFPHLLALPEDPEVEEHGLLQLAEESEWRLTTGASPR